MVDGEKLVEGNVSSLIKELIRIFKILLGVLLFILVWFVINKDNKDFLILKKNVWFRC